MKLFPHQIQGVKYMLDRKATLLAWEMGVAKSRAAATAALTWMHHHPDWKCLIISPASVKGVWHYEFSEAIEAFPIKLDDDSIGIVEGGMWPDARITIINYDLLHREEHQERLYGEPWGIIIADESHMCRNPKTLRTKHLLKLQARRKICLSGSPIASKPIEIFPTLTWLDNKTWDSYYAFGMRYCDGKRGFNNSLDFSGSSNLKELYNRLSGSLMSRILKKDVLKDLPPIMRQIIPLPVEAKCKPLIDEQLRIWKLHDGVIQELRDKRDKAKVSKDEAGYREAASELRSTFTAAMAEMSKIRQMLGVTKAPIAISHCKDLLDSGVKKLGVIAHHKQVIGMLAEGLKDYGCSVIQGSTPSATRTEIIAKFQADPENRVIVLSQQATATGITLHASSHCVFVESSWVPADNAQSEARFHRLGQVNSVMVQHLVYDGSLDARMCQRVIEKQIIIDQVIDGKDEPAPCRTEQPVKPKTDWKAIGKQMSDADKRAAQEAIRAIAKLDSDAARSCNGLGFSKIDSELGRKLACLIAPSDGQYAVMRHMSLKYKSQLSPDLRIKLLNHQVQ